MKGKRGFEAFKKGQQNTQASAKKDQKEIPSGRPEKVTKTVKTEPTDNSIEIARSRERGEYVCPKPEGLQPRDLVFPLDHPRYDKSLWDATCANCGKDDHTAYRCMGPWDPVTGTIKVCVMCNDACHGLDDCPVLTNKSASDKKFLLSRYLIVYRRGRPPIESNVCWVDLLGSAEYKEMLARHPSEEGCGFYPWTRMFAIRQHKNRPWEDYEYRWDIRRPFPTDPKTNSDTEVQENLESLKKTESSSILREMALQKMTESESEREWKLTAAGLKAWPDILEIAPKLRAGVKKQDN